MADLSYSCTVKVKSVKGENFGALAVLEYEQGGGIDIDPGTFELQITEDAAQIVRPGAVLKLTLEGNVA